MVPKRSNKENRRLKRRIIKPRPLKKRVNLSKLNHKNHQRQILNRKVKLLLNLPNKRQSLLQKKALLLNQSKNKHLQNRMKHQLLHRKRKPLLRKRKRSKPLQTRKNHLHPLKVRSRMQLHRNRILLKQSNRLFHLHPKNNLHQRTHLYLITLSKKHLNQRLKLQQSHQKKMLQRKNQKKLFQLLRFQKKRILKVLNQSKLHLRKRHQRSNQRKLNQSRLQSQAPKKPRKLLNQHLQKQKSQK